MTEHYQFTVASGGNAQSWAEQGQNLTFGLKETLGQAIVGGEFARIRFPTEAELARRHGISRVVTREAVKMLSSKGLLGARPGQGTFVQPSVTWNLFDTDVLRWFSQRRLDHSLRDQLGELRAAIEPRAAALAANQAKSANLDAIRSAIRDMMIADEDCNAPLSAIISFHVAILDATQNPFYRQMRHVVAIALRTARSAGQGRTKKVDGRQALYDAIAARDGDRSEALMRSLITSA